MNQGDSKGHLGQICLDYRAELIDELYIGSTHGSNFSAVNSFDPCQNASLCLELFNLKET